MIKKIFLYTFLLLLGMGFGALGVYIYRQIFTSTPVEYDAFQQQIIPKVGKPFMLGFTTLETERSINKLPVKGKIPSWIKGTFLAIGPGKFEINEHRATHWLDGFAMIHRFHINNGAVNYANKLVQTTYYQESIKKGMILGTASDSKESAWSKLRKAMSTKSTAPTYDNVNINVVNINDKAVACTEAPNSLCIDCNSLEIKQKLNFKDKVEGHFNCAHPLFDPMTNEWFNFTIQYAKNSNYIVYKMDKNEKRKAVASVQAKNPSYMHSFALTKNHIIITELPLTVSPFDLLMAKKGFFDTHTWNPKNGTTFIVIDRESGKVIGKYKTHPFFALHHVNAFDTKDGITIDLITYKDPEVIKALGFDHLYKKSEHHFPEGKLERFDINLKSKKVTTRVLSPKNIEMPQINYKKQIMQPYMYVFGTSMSSSEQYGDEIVKINVKTGKYQIWKEEGCFPSEPVFLASPQGKTEDDGVLLSVVLDSAKKHSFLVFIDAKTMKELGRADVPHHIPFTVHSNFMLGPIK